MNDSGISTLNVAAYYIDDQTTAAGFAPVFETAALLGAKFVCVSSYDADETRVVQTLAQLASAAQGYGLSIALKFVPYSATKTLEAAVRVHASLQTEVRAGVIGSVQSMQLASRGPNPIPSPNYLRAPGGFLRRQMRSLSGPDSLDIR